MKKTSLIRVCMDIPLYASCPYCHSWVSVELQLFYWCPKCKNWFLPYDTYKLG